MINPYVVEPHWANWMLVVEMFAGGLAAGIVFVMALMYFAGRAATGRAFADDREVSARLSLIPLPLMVLVGIILIVDLGEPLRFLNIIFRSPFAPERGPSPLIFNPNSPMNWGTYAITIFGALVTILFIDGLLHVRRLGGVRGRWRVFDTITHNPIFMAVSAFFAFTVAAYSGVLLNVTSQNVWGDTMLLGALYTAFSALSGAAAAAIVSDRFAFASTAAAVRQLLVWFAAIAGVLLVLFLVNLAIVGRVFPVIADIDQLVAPIFWIGVVGLAIAYPLLALWRGGPVRVRRGGATTAVLAGYDVGRLAIVGAGVLLGVLAFRFVILYSALAAIQ